MDGVLVVDKPAGMTSHDVVAKVRKILGTRKVGHGGTLDPDATGVLLLGIGRATRFLSYAQAAPKRYAATIALGVTTSTLDASGEVIETRDVDVDRADIERELKAFEGDIEQIPPMVSAVKVEGERLYRKARRGETVAREPRKVTIYSLELIDFTTGDQPTVHLDVTCSGGTYIRSLAADLGESLGCGAHLATLRRTGAGGFVSEEAVPLSEAGAEHVLPLAEVVRGLPILEVNEEDAISVSHGRALAAPDGISEGSVALLSAGRLIAVYRLEEERLVPERVVSA